MSLIYYANETLIFEEEAKEKLYSGKLDKFDLALKRSDNFQLNDENEILNSIDNYFQGYEPIRTSKTIEY
ncbi:hypothetical protein [Flavivirga eckloniae]|uniref:Uncharacterized protein n=1 Tax=Flavivirga eckloniae TaxID=1803846 RepID=A0A2K9PSI9_9FLAO|nr:hypothetical protein [Flavivirga eckloniae]AUP79507.1 hypothetical protein C1H87_12640 [Flavivirga eckloniae]